MKSPGFLKFRVGLSVVGGTFFLGQSLNSQFLRPGVESRDTFIYVFLALFGIAFFVQAYVFGKHLNGQSSY
jgi:hypothetical protein